VRACPDVAGRTAALAPMLAGIRAAAARQRRLTVGEIVLVKVFPIKLKDGMQAEVEEIVREFAPRGPGAEEGTLSFRVYRDPAQPDYAVRRALRRSGRV
jgi:hypothetical protein